MSVTSWFRDRRHGPDDPVGRHREWHNATHRVRSLPLPGILDWGMAITGHGMRLCETYTDATDPRDTCEELRITGVALVAIADELERRYEESTTPRKHP